MGAIDQKGGRDCDTVWSHQDVRSDQRHGSWKHDPILRRHGVASQRSLILAIPRPSLKRLAQRRAKLLRDFAEPRARRMSLREWRVPSIRNFLHFSIASLPLHHQPDHDPDHNHQNCHSLKRI